MMQLLAHSMLIIAEEARSYRCHMQVSRTANVSIK